MTLPPGMIEFVILEDGTLRTSTGNMSGPLHTTADKMLKELDLLLGGTVSIEKVKPTQGHVTQQATETNVQEQR